MSDVASNVANDLRVGLRRLAKAVAVITTCEDGKRHAMAATAISELSLDPPSMLVCVNRRATLHRVLASGAPFAINILHRSHVAISRACGGGAQGEARFGSGDWADSDLGVPRLRDAQASMICRNLGGTDHGTHSIFIGEVVEVFVNGAVDPLIYVDGRYTGMGELAEG